MLEPVADGVNNAVIGPLSRLASEVLNDFVHITGEQAPDYYGTDGLELRDDLGGLNLTTVPKALIECANMPNPTDAALITNPSWRQLAAAGIAGGLSQFLIGFV